VDVGVTTVELETDAEPEVEIETAVGELVEVEAAEAAEEAEVKTERTVVGKLVEKSVVDAENVIGAKVDVVPVTVLENENANGEKVVVDDGLRVVTEAKELLMVEVAAEESPVEVSEPGVEETGMEEETEVDERATLLEGGLLQLPDPDPSLSLPRIKAVASTP